MSTQMDHDEFSQSLEEKGENEVRIHLAQGIYGKAGAKVELVHEWLRSKDSKRASASEALQESREIDSIRLSKESNLIAKEANLIALDSSSKADEANALASRANRIAILASVIALTAIITQLIT